MNELRAGSPILENDIEGMELDEWDSLMPPNSLAWRTEHGESLTMGLPTTPTMPEEHQADAQDQTAQGMPVGSPRASRSHDNERFEMPDWEQLSVFSGPWTTPEMTDEFGI